MCGICVTVWFVLLVGPESSHKSPRLYVRRVYVREPVTIPANKAALVPVRMPFRNFQRASSGWLLDSKKIRSDQMVSGHSLLPDGDRFASVTVLNFSDHDCKVKADTFLGCAVADLDLADSIGGEFFS